MGSCKARGPEIESITSVGTAIYPIDGISLKDITTDADRKNQPLSSSRQSYVGIIVALGNQSEIIQHHIQAWHHD